MLAPETTEQKPEVSQSAELPLDLSQPGAARTIIESSSSSTPEENGEVLRQAGRRWIYGQGVGQTMLNIGAVVLFPPYAIYLVGNAGLALAGYQPLYVTDALPTNVRKNYLGAYNGVTSVPGRISASIAGEDFQQ